jgi:FkbM family methyltransferase
MEGLGEDLRFAAHVAERLGDEPFTLVDVGCSGGIDSAFRVFGENLVAVGFDPNIAEVNRLRRQEMLDSVTYVDAFVDGCSESPLIIGSNPWQRLSVAQTLEIREGARSAYSPEQRTANNLWTESTLSERHVHLPSFLRELSIDSVDFLKIDVDGADFAILQSCSELLRRSVVLGVGIEVNFWGDASPETNTFHNVDRFMRAHGYALFDLSVRRYSNRALPSRYCTTIPAQTEFGRIAQGDALYLMDVCAGPMLGEQPLSASKLTKLAALFSLFGMPDGGAEILRRFEVLIRGHIDVSLGLNTLTAQAQPNGPFDGYRTYIDAFERDDSWFWPAVPQAGSNSTNLSVAPSDSLGSEETDRANWLPQMVPGPSGFRSNSGKIRARNRRGHVAFGPNSPLQPGGFEAHVLIRVHPRIGLNRARAYVDIAAAGEQIVALAVPQRWGRHRLTLPFVVDRADAASGVEVRLHTNGRGRLTLESVEIQREPSDLQSRSGPIQREGQLSARDAVPAALIPGGAPISLPAHYQEFRNYYHRAELQTRRWFVNNVRADWVVLDVGANVGVYSILAGRLASQGQVFAFEPTSTAAMCSENLSANGVANVSVVRRAVSDMTGERFDKVYRVWGQSPDEEVFDFVSLDDFCAAESLERVDLIKVDVDGYELETIRGAQQTLKRFRPALIVEINHALQTRGVNPTDLFQFLAVLGYRAATVLDHENFLFAPADSEEPSQLVGGLSPVTSLDFDRRPVLAPEEYAAGGQITQVLLDPVTHEHGVTRSVAGGIEVVANGNRWTYAASFGGSEFCDLSGPVVVTVDIAVDSGCLGLGLFDSAMSELVSPEVFHTPSSGKRAEIVCLSPSRVGHIVVRNAHPRGEAGRAVVGGIAISEAVPVRSKQPLWEVASHVDVASIARRVGIASASQRPTNIGVVGVEDLHAACGFRQAFLPPQLAIPYGLVEFTMERDDAPILEYFYSQHSPRRHFEFGTWEGFGALLCASSCSAQIWTLNLPDGERDECGTPRYGDGATVSDAGDRIGWRYRTAGLQERVHQLYGDSRDLDTQQLGRGTFDSVLVDGGHTAPVVTSDTNKAIELLRPGGWLIWHDFVPDEVVLERSEASRGVVGAFVEGAAAWSEHLEPAFWIRPSNLCLARRKETE